ncbi:MAG: insulinase family protein, partial [Clostridia bacterium]|nr:insulinase family protein [Clostridia bacterium]
PREVNVKRTVCALDVSKPLFSIGIKDMDIPREARERTKMAYATEILDEILFSQSSEFYNDLYSKYLIGQDLSSGCEIGKNYSFNVISSESSDPDKVYSLFLDYVEKMKREGLDKEAFELSKRTVYASNIKSFDSVDDIGNNFIFNYFDGADILDTPEIISSITYDYVCELFESTFKEEYYALSIVVPHGKDK